jgi:predicted permease
MSSFLDTVAVTAVTVLKVLMASAIGSGISFALPEQSIKDVNFLNGNLFSPCFSFANLVISLTWDLVVKSWVMFLFAFITLGTSQLVGVLCAKFCCSDEWMPIESSTREKRANTGDDDITDRRERESSGIGSFLWRKLKQAITTPSPKDYQTMYLITMGTQNTGNFPIGLLVSLVGNIAWYDTAAYNQSLSVIFVYTALWTLFIWSIGLWTVQRGSKHRRIAHQLQIAARENDIRDVVDDETFRHVASMDDLAQATKREHRHTDRRLSPTRFDGDNESHDDVASVVKHYTQEMLEMNCSITTLDLHYDAQPPEPVGEVPSTTTDDEIAKPSPPLPRHAVVAQKLARINLPIVGCVLGIVVALTPPLRWVFHTAPLQVVVGGIGLIGDGCVPLSLLILGANLTSGGLKPLLKIDPRYLLVGTIAKTVIIPAMNVAIFFLCDFIGLLPEDRVLRITVWVEIIAPSAVMATVICRLEDYMAECATGLLLVQYVVATFTTTAWLSLFLLLHPW